MWVREQWQRGPSLFTDASRRGLLCVKPLSERLCRHVCCMCSPALIVVQPGERSELCRTQMRACTTCCPAAWGSFRSRMSHARSDADKISKHTGGGVASASSSSQRSREVEGNGALASIVSPPPSCVWTLYHRYDRYTGDEDGRVPPPYEPMGRTTRTAPSMGARPS